MLQVSDPGRFATFQVGEETGLSHRWLSITLVPGTIASYRTCVWSSASSRGMASEVKRRLPSVSRWSDHFTYGRLHCKNRHKSSARTTCHALMSAQSLRPKSAFLYSPNPPVGTFGGRNREIHQEPRDFLYAYSDTFPRRPSDCVTFVSQWMENLSTRVRGRHTAVIYHRPFWPISA